MKTRYRLIRRGHRGGAFYCVGSQTGKRTSLGAASEDEAHQIVHAKNQAERQPLLNLQIAKAYLAGSDSNFVKRTWAEVMNEFVKTKSGSNRRRYDCAITDKAYDSIRNRTLLETQPEHFLRVLQDGGVSTNNHLRRFHNFALDVGWLLRPVLPKRQWPAVRYKVKRAITRAEHDLIVSRENNVELRAFLWCCWHLGGSQTDLANLKADDIDWENQVVSFFRRKTGTAQVVRFGTGLAEVLRTLSQVGLLFPRLAVMDEKHRASRFQRACRRVKVKGVSLHSYRYAWAERAKQAGYSCSSLRQSRWEDIPSGLSGMSRSPDRAQFRSRGCEIISATRIQKLSPSPGRPGDYSDSGGRCARARPRQPSPRALDTAPVSRCIARGRRSQCNYLLG